MVSQLERDPVSKTEEAPRTSGGNLVALLRKFSSDSRVHVALLFGLVFLCFGRTLGSFFIADDFGEVRYVAQIFNGDPDLIWANMTGPYLQNPTILIWRPWMLLSQVIDYGLWGPSPFGYYLTNLLYTCGTVSFLYLCLRLLTRQWPAANSIAFALISAALFAVNPLHCESISWMVGRVDILCAFFSLLSFNLFLASTLRNHKLNRILGTVAFWLALASKEMAVTMPLTITAAYFFLFANGERTLCAPDTVPDGLKIKVKETGVAFVRRARESFQFAQPLWISLCVYFPLRLLFLGTLFGGYTGDIGAAQGQGALQRWMDTDTLLRIFYPLNASIVQSGSAYGQALNAIYISVLAITVFRLLSGNLPFKWLTFMAVWIFAAIVPIYKLWGLGAQLEGARFYFFLTIPLAVLAPLVVLYPSTKGSKDLQSIDKKLALVAAVALVALISVDGKLSYSTNLLWVHAGKEVRSFWNQCKGIALSLPPETRVAILGIPKRHCGAHMILNSLTFQFMLSPPFTSDDMFGKFSVFDPVFFSGESPFISATAFKRVTQNPHTAAVLVWKGSKEGFNRLQVKREVLQQMPFELIPYTMDQIWQVYTKDRQKTLYLEKSNIMLQQVKQDDGLRFFNLSLNPVDWDFFEFEMRGKPTKANAVIKAVWNGDENNVALAAVPADCQGEYFSRVRLRLSHSWRWFAYQRIRELQLLLPDLNEVEIRHPRLISDRTVAPRLDLLELPQNFASISVLKGKTARLLYNGQTIENAATTEVEVSKPGFFFDNFSDEQISKIVEKRLLFKDNTGVVVLDKSTLPSNGYRQIRARCLDANGCQVGEYSDVLTLNVRRN